jgi:hypothetical protein
VLRIFATLEELTMQIKLTEISTLVIGMISEAQRNEHIKNLCLRLGLQGKFIQSIFCDPGYFGCTIGHLKALVLAKKSHQLPILLLENDCDATKFFQTTIDVPDDSDMVYLGSSACGCVPQMNYQGIRGCALVENTDPASGFYKVRNMTATHAILYVSGRSLDAAINSILESIALSRPIDVGYVMDLQPSLNIYSTYLPWFFQTAKLQKLGELALVMQQMTLDEAPQPRKIGDTLSYVTGQSGGIVHLTLINKGTHSEWVPRDEKIST